MARKHPAGDRNFDGLVKRFQRNIYQTMKGQVRLAVLRRDFMEFVTESELHVLDVGAGEGRWAAELLTAGHHVTLSDISGEMLDAARGWFSQQPWWAECQNRVRWSQCPLQEIDREFQVPFDVVNCHAVLEWLDDPSVALGHLASVLKPGGWLSVIFYNVDGLIFKNLLRGNYQKIASQDFRGYRGSLTPSNPLRISDVLSWFAAQNMDVQCQSGIRVFHDYILDAQVKQANPSQALAMELNFSRLQPYRDLGRYIHLLARKH